ncbi:hypothetical protein DEU56DRAFT_910509 [Suillus clintonianus]|uniref:uncharacterized protein n=1 Tax=Suillus clintonianus TaxID=1904413 RepID=UPI001B878E72|nr:uncharacterized protein DEU56DRAFT_910509 [Suillus clintonianus]KAG2144578.1 hypothetical protein DEU56DRAFT_910509 [Suillus clintonianus]
MISEWEVPKEAFKKLTSKAQVSDSQAVSILESDNASQYFICQILVINANLRNACIAGDLSTADLLLTQNINADGNNYTSYANRSFVMERRHDWDNALHGFYINTVAAMYFRYAMLSHRWEVKEPLLLDVRGKVVYVLDPVGSITKLHSFCKTARDAGYRWTWSDTCCINRSNNIESINSMFVWYHHSALTVVYLSDVLPSSKSGALAKSV